MYRGNFSRGGGRSAGPHNRPPRHTTHNRRPSRAPQGQRIDIRRFINKAVITEDAPNFVPEHTFADFQIDERLKKNIIAKGYLAPTPIQDRVIPYILRGSDVVGIANTGTGKTAAFLIPLIHKVLKKPDEQIIIVVPTRELAVQIDMEFKEFSRGLGLHSVLCIGGAHMGRQMRELKLKNSFVIGTPGRLKDHVRQKTLHLAKFNTVVLDEADRMLDMGFIGDMKFMLALMPKERHTLFFSATMSSVIQGLIKEFLKEPVTISVKTAETAENVEQDIVKVRGNKVDVLHDLLAQKGFEKVLVFGRTKHGVERLAKELAARGFKAESIHGNKNQTKRQKALTLFRNSDVQVLVATDVAARGLDIGGVSHVINYDIPMTYNDYIHRIGRTGRAGKKGKALTFVE